MGRRKQYLIPILVLVGVLTLTIGFASFSSNLVVQTGVDVTPNASSFKVVFSKSATSEEAGTINPITGNGASATIDNTSNSKPTISNLSANFVSPGETSTYEFYAYNKGEYKAYLTNIAFNNVGGKPAKKVCTAGTGTSQELVDAACEGIKIHISVDGILADETMDTSGHAIEKGLSHKVVLTMEYENDAARADGPFTVTFGEVQLTYMSIEGVGTSTGGLTGGTIIQNVEFGETYTLKNGETWNVLATQNNINSATYDPNIYGYGSEMNYYAVILNDGSEWYLSEPLNTSSNKIRLISKYNYFVSGPKIGEMDPSGALNPMAATSEVKAETYCDCVDWNEEEICTDDGCYWEQTCLEESCYETGNYTYETDYINPIINNYIKPKLILSLGLKATDVSVFMPEGSYEGGMVEDMFSPQFWLPYSACNGYCSDSSNSTKYGVRVEIILDKSNVMAILSKDKGYKVDNTLGIYYDKNLDLSLRKIGETDTHNIYISGYDDWADHSVYIYDLATGKVIGGAEDSNSLAPSLGYPYVGENEDNGFDMYDVSVDVENIDNAIVRQIIECDGGFEYCYTTSGKYCAILVRIPK